MIATMFRKMAAITSEYRSDYPEDFYLKYYIPITGKLKIFSYNIKREIYFTLIYMTKNFTFNMF